MRCLKEKHLIENMKEKQMGDYFGDRYPPFRSIVPHPLGFLFRRIVPLSISEYGYPPLGIGFDVANVLVF